MDFGAVIGFAHDWANRENTKKSWDLVARYVIPEINSMLDDYRDSYNFVINNRDTWLRAKDARFKNVEQHEKRCKSHGNGRVRGEKAKTNQKR